MVTKKYTYDAFGVEINPDTNDVNVFRYCGEYFDSETGTVYLRARYYQASTGRFISRDSYAGRRSDPLSLNLYTYCRNNPIRYVDPSGHSYATLPSGNRMTINSASDARLFSERRSRFIDTATKNKTTTASLIEGVTPSVGTISQKSITTYTTVAEEITETEDPSIFERICMWSDRHIIEPVASSLSKFGSAIYHSVSFEYGAGCGFGAEVSSGCVSGSLLLAPFREEYVLASDCKRNITGNYSAGVTFFDTIGLSAEAKRTAFNNYKNGNPYTAPDGHWENELNLISAYSSSNDKDFNIEIGGALYFVVGVDFTFSFNLSNFAKELGIL